MTSNGSLGCLASSEPAQIHESITKMKMEIQKKIWTSRYNKIGSITHGKSQVIWVSIRNKQLDLPTLEKVGPPPGTSKNDSFL